MAARATVLVLPLALLACSRPSQPAAPAPPAAAASTASTPTFIYACDNGETLRAGYPDARTAIVDYRGRLSTLTVARSGSGARYVGDGLQWWTRGTAEGAVSPLGVGETMASGGAVRCHATGAGPAADAAASSSAANPPAPGEPGGLPDDRTPVVEAPAAATSPQAAGQVVQTYFALIEARRYEDAYRLWGDGGRAAGPSASAFAKGFGAYGEYHANIGAPGQPEGAAGSIYVDVPVQVYGRRKTGEAFTQTGRVSLRRVNDVPGATPDQLRWRIAAVELKPAPGR